MILNRCRDCGYSQNQNTCPMCIRGEVWVDSRMKYEQSPALSSLQSSTGGIKHDQDKPDLSMVSYELMEEVAKVRMFGAKKYSRDNWKNGFKVTRSLAAALRHIFLFLSGETNDEESGLSHLAHGVCCLEHAIYDMKHHPKNDDRNLDSVPKTT